MDGADGKGVAPRGMRRSRALGVSSEGAPELEPIPLSNEGGANRFILQSARGGEPPSASPTTLQAMGRVFVKDARRRASGKDPEYSAEQVGDRPNNPRRGPRPRRRACMRSQKPGGHWPEMDALPTGRAIRNYATCGMREADGAWEATVRH